jgi:hypothetical protein
LKQYQMGIVIHTVLTGSKQLTAQVFQKIASITRGHFIQLEHSRYQEIAAIITGVAEQELDKQVEGC